jgi:hypothetical protein
VSSDSGTSPSRNLIKWAVLFIFFIMLGYFVGYYFALVASLSIAAVFVNMDSRVLYIAALVLLIIAAPVTALSLQSLANWLASISYYSLATGIIIDLSHYVKSGTETDAIRSYDQE